MILCYNFKDGGYMNQEKIGKFIYDLRKKYNLTQAELANRLHVTAQAVSKWENGRGVPDIELLKRLSEEFDVSISELIEGKKENKRKNKITFIVATFLIIIVISILIIVFIFQNNNSTFNFSTLVCQNDSFSINGVIAYDDAKKSVYISNIHYCDETIEEPKAIAVECILYEMVNDEEIKIAKYGSLSDVLENDYISKYLSNVEFNIDDYTCGCNKDTCNNLHIRINALNEQNEVITYEIPLSVDRSCSE